MKISDTTRSTIQTSLLNFMSTLTSDDDVDIQFENVDDGENNSIQFKAVKKSKTPSLMRTVKLVDNKLKVDVQSNKGVQSVDGQGKPNTNE